MKELNNFLSELDSGEVISLMILLLVITFVIIRFIIWLYYKSRNKPNNINDI